MSNVSFLVFFIIQLTYFTKFVGIAVAYQTKDVLRDCAKVFVTLMLTAVTVRFVKTEYAKLDVVLTQFVPQNRHASIISVKVSFIFEVASFSDR